MIFSYSQVVWILNNYELLSSGIWPNPFSEVYFTKISPQAFPHAHFENPCLLAAEVHNRIKRCGIDGILVEERYGLRNGTEPKLEEDIARERRIKIKIVFSTISRVIKYSVSEDMMGLSYNEWRRKKNNS